MPAALLLVAVPLLVAALLLFVRLQVSVLLFVAARPALLAVLPELQVVLPAPL